MGESNQTRQRIKFRFHGNGLTGFGCEGVRGKIDLLKMDCEGSEWDILENLESLKSVDNITLEYHFRANQKITIMQKIW